MMDFQKKQHIRPPFLVSFSSSSSLPSSCFKQHVVKFEQGMEEVRRHVFVHRKRSLNALSTIVSILWIIPISLAFTLLPLVPTNTNNFLRWQRQQETNLGNHFDKTKINYHNKNTMCNNDVSKKEVGKFGHVVLASSSADLNEEEASDWRISDRRDFHPEYSVFKENEDVTGNNKSLNLLDSTEDYKFAQNDILNHLVENPTTGSFQMTSVAEVPPREKDNSNKAIRKGFEYVAFQPSSLASSSSSFGSYCSVSTPVQIKVGNVQLARKAWKKRRRSGSPLLVPCSIISVDRSTAIRSNIIYLVQKFGQQRHSSSTGMASDTQSSSTTSNLLPFNSKGLRLSLHELKYRHRTHLKSSLTHHAIMLGYKSELELIQSLFQVMSASNNEPNNGTPLTVIVRNINKHGDNAMIEDNDVDDQNVWLELSLVSRLRAQKIANEAAIIQFTESSPLVNSTSSFQEKKDSKESNPTILRHTGWVRNRKKVDQTTTTTEDFSVSNNANSEDNGINNEISVNNKTHSNSKKVLKYYVQPLSVALRVTQDNVDNGIVHEGSVHSAAVFSYDSLGDNGNPLLTLSLNTRSMNSLASSNLSRKAASSLVTTDKNVDWDDVPIQHSFDELVSGQRLNGTVVKIVRGGALVDCSVGHQTPSINGDKISKKSERVYGLLLFKDAVIPVDGDVDQRRNIRERNGGDVVEDDENDNFDDDEEEDEDKEWNEVFALEDLDNIDDDDDDDDDDDYDDDLDESKMDGEIRNKDQDSKSSVLQKALDMYDFDEDDEESEDVTHLCVQNEDGSFTYTDPETGETQTVFPDFDHDHDHDHEDDDDDGDDDYDNDVEVENEDNDLETEITSAGSFSGSATSAATIMSSTPTIKDPLLTLTKMKRKRLNVGDTVSVLVKYLPKKPTNRFILTMDPSIQGKKPKDIKKEKEFSRKLSRLSKQLGGLNVATELQGKECVGIIKATSNVGGNWLYIQPCWNDQEHLPVGIAPIPKQQQHDGTGTGSSSRMWNVGDKVRVRFAGVDEERGQLSLQII